MTLFESLHDAELVKALQAGAVGVILTDTVYGLVCRAADEQAVDRLYALKGRENKPGTIIAASVEQLVELGLKARYLKAVEHYWPNPISVIIPNYGLKHIHLGTGGIAVRVPADDGLIRLLSSTGPLLTTSANHPGQPDAADIGEAQEYFHDAVDFYVDGGHVSGRKPSTLIRIVDDAVEVLRQGAVVMKENGEIQK